LTAGRACAIGTKVSELFIRPPDFDLDDSKEARAAPARPH